MADAVDALGTDAVAWIVEASERVVQRFTAQTGDAPEFGGSAHRARRSIETALLCTMICVRRADPEADLPAFDAVQVDIARRGARSGLPLEAIVNRVWAGHMISKDELTTSLAELLSGDELREAIRDTNTLMFAIGSRFVRQIGHEYEREARLWRDRRSEAQFKMLVAVGDGASPAADAEKVLGSRFDSAHVFGLVWPRDQAHPADWRVETAEFAARAGHAASAHRSLSVEHEGRAFLWWAFTEPPAPETVALLAGAPRPGWMQLVVGPVGSGVEGFRESFRGAHLIERLALASTAERAWTYDETAHLALLAADREAATQFVRTELGPLLGRGRRMAEVRETVRLYLSSGRSRMEVAGMLHLSPNTVAYRVAQAADLLGRPITERSERLLLALSLAQLGFGDKPER